MKPLLAQRHNHRITAFPKARACRVPGKLRHRKRDHRLAYTRALVSCTEKLPSVKHHVRKRFVSYRKILRGVRREYYPLEHHHSGTFVAGSSQAPTRRAASTCCASQDSSIKRGTHRCENKLRCTEDGRGERSAIENQVITDQKTTKTNNPSAHTTLGAFPAPGVSWCEAEGMEDHCQQWVRGEGKPLAQRRSWLLHLKRIRQEKDARRSEMMVIMEHRMINLKQKLNRGMESLKFTNILTRKINGRFGASGVAVFCFIRDLLVLNTIISLLMWSLLGTPLLGIKGEDDDRVGGWVKHSHRNFSDGASITNAPDLPYEAFYADDLDDQPPANFTDDNFCSPVALTFGDDKVTNCSRFYLDSLMEMKGGIKTWTSPPLVSQILLAKGHLEYSLLFLGRYPAATPQMKYSWAAVHVVGVVVTLAVSLVVVVKRVGQWLCFNASVPGDLALSKMVFCGYDYSLTDKRFIASKQNNLKTEIRATLDEEEFQRSKNRRTHSQLVVLHAKRIAVNCVIFLVVSAGCWVIVMVAKHSLELMNNTNFHDPWMEDMTQFLLSFLDTLTVWLLGLVLPPMLSSLGSVEEYSSRVTLLLFILRNATFRFISIGALVVSQLSVRNDTLSACHSDTPCWETALGQKLYAQVVWDFMMRAVKMFLLLVYRILTLPCALSDDSFLPAFDVTEKVLDVLTLQTLCWLSVPVAPLLPGLVLTSLVVLWLLEMAVALLASRPATRVIQVSRSSALFMVVLAVAWVGAAAHAIAVLGFLTPSLGCGPYRGLDQAWRAFTFATCHLDERWAWLR
ncbi:uncharacterized protein LOC126981105 isoform X2 [Eriocheir sinensis]|nr:uncharacterized protein LOC126981105 isoform X2 [Eriocheir sinensis]